MQRSGEFVVYRELPDDTGGDGPRQHEYMCDMMGSNGTGKTNDLTKAIRWAKPAAFKNALYMKAQFPSELWSVAEVIATPNGVTIDK